MNENRSLHLWPSDASLITRLVDEELFCFVPKDQLRNIAVVLPTKRLGTYLLAALGKKFGSFIPPKIMTLETFVQELASDRPNPKRVIPGPAIEMLLATIISEKNYTHIHTGHVQEIRVLFLEIAEQCSNNATAVTNKAVIFEKLRRTLSEDVYRSDAHIGSLFKRVDELEDLFDSFFGHLKKCNAQSQQECIAECATYILDKSEEDIFSNFSFGVYFVGFTSVREPLRPLLANLAKMKNCHFWFNEFPSLPCDQMLARQNPLNGLIQTILPGKDNECMVRHDRKDLTQTSSISVHAAQTPIQEIALALDKVSSLIQAGYPPSQIAILLTNEREYGKLLRTMIMRMGLEANMAVTIPLSQISFGAWLNSLSEIFISDDETTALVSWLTNPITLGWFQETKPAPELASSILCEVFETAPPSGLLNLAQKVLVPFRELGRTKQAPIQEWHDCLLKFIGIFEQSFSRNDELFAAAFGAVKSGFLPNLLELARLRQAGPGSVGKISQNQFWKFFRDHLLTVEIRTTGEPLFGVQVLNLSEARNFPFEAALVLGCTDNNLPKSQPNDELIDDFLKRKAGLSGWQALEAIEEITFNLLMAQTPKVDLFYSKTKEAGMPNARSRFLDLLIFKNHIEVETHHFDIKSFWRGCFFSRSASNCSLPARVAEPEGMLPPPFSREDLLKSMSASSLEKLICCPYRFLLSRLGLNEFPVAIPKPDLDEREEGTWLHKVLEELFKDWPAEESIPTDPILFKEVILCKLDELSIKLGPKDITKKSLYFHLKNFAWPKFADHLFNLHFSKTSTFRPSKDRIGEVRFGSADNATRATISLGDLAFEISGSIDSVDFLNSGSEESSCVLITDYKRKGVPDKKGVNQCTSPQLPFYALALSSILKQNNLSNMIIGYWSILNGNWAERGVGKNAKDLGVIKNLATSKTLDLEELVHALKQAWQWRLDYLLNPENRFIADPSACGLCGFSGICRKDEAPSAMADRIESQNMLERRLKAEKR